MHFQYASLLSFTLIGAVFALPSPFTVGETSSFAGGKCQVRGDGAGNYSSVSKCIKTSGGLGVGSCCWPRPDVGSLKAQIFDG